MCRAHGIAMLANPPGKQMPDNIGCSNTHQYEGNGNVQEITTAVVLHMSVTGRSSPFSLCIRYTTSAAPLDVRKISFEAGRRLDIYKKHTRRGAGGVGGGWCL